LLHCSCCRPIAARNSTCEAAIFSKETRWLVAQLRSGPTGKVLKTKLRELYGNRDFAAISLTKTP